MLITGCHNDQNRHVTSFDGVEIHYVLYGTDETAIVFVHGWTNDYTIWDNQNEFFSKNFTVAAIDLAGHGSSGENRNNWSIESFGMDIQAVINDLPCKKAVLVGFSMGGPAVLEAAKHMPDKIIGVVLVDALEDINVEYSSEEIEKLENIMMDVVNNPSPEKLEGIFYKKNVDAAFKRIEQILDKGPKPYWRELLHETIRWQNDDCKETIQNTKAPIMAIYSDNAPINDDAFRSIKPDFQYKVIPETGHLVMWDAPQNFNQRLQESIDFFMKN